MSVSTPPSPFGPPAEVSDGAAASTAPPDPVAVDVTFGALGTVSREADGSMSIDGSVLEGGGQILRNSMALSALLRQDIKISRIRANRSKGGLKAQHLSGIQAISEMYSGVLVGAAVDSCEVEFKPRVFTPGQYLIDIKTAGSVALVVQATLPCMLFGAGPSQLKIMGGTNVTMAPQVDYLNRVFKPNVTAMGIDFDLSVRQRGFFPKGGGEVTLRVPERAAAVPISPIVMVKRGSITSIHIWTFFGGRMPRHVGDRILAGARDTLRDGLVERKLSLMGVTSEVEDCGPARDGGAGCIITATTSKGYILAGTSLLEHRQEPQAAGVTAAVELLSTLDHGGCVDEHMQDQLIIFMALAHGRSSVSTGPLSMHTKTSIFIAGQLTGAAFTVTESDQGIVISCDGIGYTRERAASGIGSAKRKRDSGGAGAASASGAK